MTSPASSADGIRWDLRDLYAGLDDPRIEGDLQQALTRAQQFEADYRERIRALQAGDAAKLRAAVQELEDLYEQMDRPLAFAMLLHAGRSDDPKHGALLSRCQELQTQINQHLIFFDLEWVAVSAAIADAMAAEPALARYRHWLEQKRVWKPHYLSEPEEKILDRKSITGRSAFARLFEESTSTIRFTMTLGGAVQNLSLQEILARLYDVDRNVRKAAADGISEGLKANARLLTFIFNTLILDHQMDGQLRRHPTPMNARNLANEISEDVVEALMAATESRFDLVQRYYRLKGKLTGIAQLADYDRYAPLSSDLPECRWQEARKIVQESYDAFSPRAGGIVREFFDKGWIDAELRPSKRGGAFSSSTVPSAHPYILMNYTDRLRDVMTLAHELGHGVHQHLSRGVGYLQCGTPLTTAEMASIFGEMLTFRRLQQIYAAPRQRLAMICSKLEDTFATVFRQVVLTRFELSAHTARRDQGELSAEAINELWMRANQAMFGDVVTLGEGYAWWWSYIGHFIRSPFYCYAYAFGELLVLALFQKYQQEGESFVPRYLELLSRGGSDAPHLLLGRLGVDVTDPAFWQLGLQLLEGMVAEAEQLAETA